MSGELCSQKDSPAQGISRREFLWLGLFSAAFLLEPSAILKVLPLEFDGKLARVDGLLRDLSKKIYLEEGGKVPELNSDGIAIIYLAKNNFNFLQPLGNPNDLTTWQIEKKPFTHNFEAEKPDITGGISRYRGQAKEIFDAYLTNDQYRVAKITLSARNSTGSFANTVEWEAGMLNEDFKERWSLWDFYRTYIHELTHAGNPLNGTKLVDGKFTILPYGLRKTLDFVQEIIAINCTNYILPPFDMDLAKIIAEKHEPLKSYPLTERAIRKSIAYVHYGVMAGDLYPDVVTKRNGFTPGTPIGDLFWKIYSMWDE